MSQAPPPSAAIPCQEEHLAAVLDAAIDALRQGLPLDRAELLGRHPELRDALAALDHLVTPDPTHPDSGQTYHKASHPSQIGPYRILRHLGTGSFGTVYLAYDPDVRRRVALKVLHAERLEESEVVTRFQREACVIARLQHPGIVKLYDYSRQGPPYYLVTEYVEGSDPRQWCRSHHCGMREIASLVVRIAEAVEHAHALGVCHRDLKPGNILVDEGGCPHVLDFGLARLSAGTESTQHAQTSDGRILGSLAYMAPEQAAGNSHAADARSDVYALGGILYELLTGRVPFEGPAHALPARVLEDNPPPPRSLNPAIPVDLAAICIKALAKRPDERYRSAGDLAADLRRYLQGEPVIARRLTWLVYIQRVLNRTHHDIREQGWTILLMALGLTIFAGCCLANWFERTLPASQSWLPMLLTKLVQIAVMLYLAVRLRPVKQVAMTVVERQIWCLVPGYYGGFLALLLVNCFLPEPMPLAPILAVMSGMGFATLGATIWGWFYVWGFFFFALAVLIAICTPFGLTLLGLGWLIALAVGSLHLHWTR